jgi:hypothetical protein
MHDDILIDTDDTGVTRRELFRMGNVLAMPVLFGGVAGRATAAPAPGPLTPGPQIYQSIGVEPRRKAGWFGVVGFTLYPPSEGGWSRSTC